MLELINLEDRIVMKLLLPLLMVMFCAGCSVLPGHNSQDSPSSASNNFVGIHKAQLKQCMGKPQRKFSANSQDYYVYQAHHARCRIVFVMQHDQVKQVYATDLLDTKIPLDRCPNTKMDCLQ